MVAEQYRSYGAALRLVVRGNCCEYDRETLAAFVADLYSKHISDVRRDLDAISAVKVR